MQVNLTPTSHLTQARSAEAPPVVDATIGRPPCQNYRSSKSNCSERRTIRLTAPVKRMTAPSNPARQSESGGDSGTQISTRRQISETQILHAKSRMHAACHVQSLCVLEREVVTFAGFGIVSRFEVGTRKGSWRSGPWLSPFSSTAVEELRQMRSAGPQDPSITASEKDGRPVQANRKDATREEEGGKHERCC